VDVHRNGQWCHAGQRIFVRERTGAPIHRALEREGRSAASPRPWPHRRVRVRAGGPPPNAPAPPRRLRGRRDRSRAPLREEGGEDAGQIPTEPISGPRESTRRLDRSMPSRREPEVRGLLRTGKLGITLGSLRGRATDGTEVPRPGAVGV
jgi:hypothetical protein